MSPEKKATIEAFGKAVAAHLMAIREESGVTQMQLAKATGISQSQLSKQLRGLRAINIDELSAICAGLGISMVSVIASAENDVRPADDLKSRRERALRLAKEGKAAAQKRTPRLEEPESP
ncbi:helix-turn-helix transcriptional regulator [Corynebacterium glucuronolyticum]|uniref:Helix-turn-helix transcriptional regulator n=1 Tax=Corynebacterium glucuronolyticum TaxID=39791 RepID=A0A7T4JUV1_9CORY|nr:helix-turn-helix transcriptional regulator [Corynebacterium glucuronolyticum]QQB46231.1 helix-turn-helix transcriptional regulator [Corynebacterium glucuronolyticum]WKD63011.1 Helix-turn-helix protein [Corynebacterium glucuronolyticum DSM 44120]SMB85671.1 Helix-turn-helix [Corynebacterium glucuronolyticum]